MRKVMTLTEMTERAENLHRHVEEHPADYVAVIAELKLRSDIIDKARKDMVNARLKEVARIRKRRKEYEKQGQ
jgi:ribosomal protein S15P/S13E